MQYKSILIVDDDIDLMMLLERELLKRGYIVETAASLPEAEEFLGAHAPDLVLLDINLDGDDGRQLCWKIKRNEQHHAKVMMMSGFDFHPSRSILFGADDFLAKPFNIELLTSKVKSLIGIAVATKEEDPSRSS
ncbi:MAG: response regulator transcription factor [Flavisolibacter sp.]